MKTGERIPWGIIPDIHADLALLETAIKQLADENVSNFAFLGDFIDAGHGRSYFDDRGVLTKVRHLIDCGAACGVMGNHELNAILFHSLGQDGQPLRARSQKNCQQHQSFIDQIGIGSFEADEWVKWFLGLPLWLELESFRLVHAYWGQREIDLISARRPDGRLKPEDLVEVAQQNTDFGKAVQMLVCGPEITLFDGSYFEDIRGNRRHDVRIAWWRAQAKTWRDIVVSVADPEKLPSGNIPEDIGNFQYPPDALPVFCGHYKMQGQPKLECPNVLSLDYPQNPFCYRSDAQKLENRNLLRLKING